ncbi:hypothetical protein CDAR_401501 [Caerostris darwini]|uniref:Uncharacterized protein n=1 Tax=Caerostris darwini TaxID=1538125 RepID=A0AAV4RR11_9ARAC|nr:hypothetical protein CDAR_401501 [Caerostris darwini]
MRNAPLQAAFLSINAEGLTYKCGVTTSEGTSQKLLKNKIKEVWNEIFRKVSSNAVRKVLPRCTNKARLKCQAPELKINICRGQSSVKG